MINLRRLTFVHPTFIALELSIFDFTTVVKPVSSAIMVADNVRGTFPLLIRDVEVAYN